MNYRERIWREKPAKDFFLDFAGCKTLGELHMLLKDILEFLDFYGENLSALWDCITGFMYLPAHITIKKSVNQELIVEVDDIIKIFRRAEEMYGDITVNVLEADS